VEDGGVAGNVEAVIEVEKGKCEGVEPEKIDEEKGEDGGEIESLEVRSELRLSIERWFLIGRSHSDSFVPEAFDLFVCDGAVAHVEAFGEAEVVMGAVTEQFCGNGYGGNHICVIASSIHSSFSEAAGIVA
jgi:hypothetical protein